MAGEPARLLGGPNGALLLIRTGLPEPRMSRVGLPAPRMSHVGAVGPF